MSVKGLHKIIYPFAPDQSGAVSVLYELGGMIIICDAGGCAGNICGFDEPRWADARGSKSAIFSAGLRDMDAILGRDDLMIDKIAKASRKTDAKFVAIIGTPVPATIATDYRALKRMAEKRTGLPVITIDTNGARWYDEGVEKAYMELFKKFAGEASAVSTVASAGSAEATAASGFDAVSAGSSAASTVLDAAVSGSDALTTEHDAASAEAAAASASAEAASTDRTIIGILGVTPLDMDCLDAGDRIRARLNTECTGRIVCYGNAAPYEEKPSGINAFECAKYVDRNIVVAPSGLKAARYLKKKFDTPYVCADPLVEDIWNEILRSSETKAAAAKVSETKGADMKSSDTKTVDNNSIDTKTVDKNSVDTKTAGKNSVDTKTAGKNSFDTKTADIKSYDTKAAETSLLSTLAGKRILIIHQQVRANALRDLIRGRLAGKTVANSEQCETASYKTEITVATWFMLDDEISEDRDLRIRDEAEFISILERGSYDVIIADGTLRKAAEFSANKRSDRTGSGRLFIELPHFAISGRLQK